MSTWIWIVIAAAVVIVVLAVIATALRSRRSNRRTGELRGQFGPEYERTVASAGSRRDAEAELEARREHRAQLEIRELPQSSRDRYLASWKVVQAQFVDDPQVAVAGADSLIRSVMSERGYPVDDFEQRAADISVDHPEVVEHSARPSGSPGREAASPCRPRRCAGRCSTIARSSRSSSSRTAIVRSHANVRARCRTSASRRDLRHCGPRRCFAGDRSDRHE